VGALQADELQACGENAALASREAVSASDGAHGQLQVFVEEDIKQPIDLEPDEILINVTDINWVQVALLCPRRRVGR
jgi:hypothetical protein